MHIYFDESGDFGFSKDRFDLFTQAAAICPDSELSDLEAFVADRHQRWGVDELHAADLSPGQRLRLCRFVAASSLQLVVHATDTQLTTADSLHRWRRLQSQRMTRNLKWYREQGGDAETIVQWMTASAKRVDLATRISDPEFLQAVLLIDLIHAALQKSVIFYMNDEWRDDFARFRFVADGKLPGKLGAGEKFLEQALVPILGSNARFSLELVDSWHGQTPAHPFIANFERPGGWSGARRARLTEPAIEISAIFEPGLEFEPSHQHAGLQIADLAAYVVRNAVLRPDDDRAQLAYDLLRPRLRTLDGTTVRLVRLNTTRGRVPLDRYRHIHRRPR